MPACDKWSALNRSALEQLSVPELEALLDKMFDSPAPTDAESARMLEIIELLERRADNRSYIRTDARAALSRFRETFLPSAETDGGEDAAEPALQAVADHREQERLFGSLPAFVAAFTASKQLSAQEVDEIQRMIDDYRKEL